MLREVVGISGAGPFHFPLGLLATQGLVRFGLGNPKPYYRSTRCGTGWRIQSDLWKVGYSPRFGSSRRPFSLS